MDRFTISKALLVKLRELDFVWMWDSLRYELAFSAMLYDVKVHVYWNTKRYADAVGFIESNSNKIWLSSSLLPELDKCVSTFFHEVGHIHCRRNKIWKAYHLGKPGTKAAILTAWKAEKFVDSWAKKEMHKYFGDLKYYRLEDDEEDIKITKKYYRDFAAGLLN